MGKQRNWERYLEIGLRISDCRRWSYMTQEEMAEKLNYFLE